MFTTSCRDLLLFLNPENHFLTAYYKYCMDLACMGLTKIIENAKEAVNGAMLME